VKQPGDVVVVSVHWGSNWGYRVSSEERLFAHRLVEGGVDVVHGHSSHHPRPIEVYRDRLILYGCGDFIDDYEGIGAHAEYRDDLRVMFFVSLEPVTGALASLTMTPLQACRMRLVNASDDDAAWLRRVIDEISAPFGTRIELHPNGTLRLDGG
jgi:poly-gamma-glutamate capsule biosynthesis protein CapA/YwtB (metallophosphatase superfamily)